MDQALTNKKFIEQIDDVIETLGGTPVDLELTEDREDDMVSNDVFIDKMDEVIEALGGTPSEIIVGDDKADDMVSDNIFQLKMEDVVKNMSGGGGGGDLTVTVQTLNIPQTTLTGEESEGWYYASAEVGTMSSEIVDGIPYDENNNYYTIYDDNSINQIDGVDFFVDMDFDNSKFVLRASSENAFTITYPATTVTYFRATKEVADTFGDMAVIYSGF